MLWILLSKLVESVEAMGMDDDLSYLVSHLFVRFLSASGFPGLFQEFAPAVTYEGYIFVICTLNEKANHVS
jgi:hypothetical protein